MLKSDLTLKAILVAIVVLLGVIALHPLLVPLTQVQAQSSRFDHIFLVSTLFLYRGQQGLLVMDRRNANVWFIPKVNDAFQDPIFVVRMPFEKLDQVPR